jgi:mono/diheme cytochrome c family protein
LGGLAAVANQRKIPKIMPFSSAKATAKARHLLPRTRSRVLVCVAGLWLASVTGAGMHAAGPQAQRTGPALQTTAPAADVTTADGRRAALDRYCVTCHNSRAKVGDLSLEGLDPARVSERPDVWEQVVRKLRTGTMPPHGMPRPDPVAYDRLASYLETELDRAAPANPGRPLLRRLNRAEYANSIRDLLDLTVDVRTLLPADDSAFGFDNVGDLLVVSPALLERYLDAADRVSALAVGDPGTAPGAETYFVRGDQSQNQHLEGLPLGTVGGLAVRHTFPLDGEYQFHATLLRNNLEGIRGLEHTHQIEFSVDGERVFVTPVGGDAEKGQEGSITARSDATDARLKVRVPVTAGPHVLAATFVRKTGAGTNRLRPFLRSNAGTYDSTGRPHIESFTVTGPFNPTGPGDTPSRRRIFTCRADSERCATEILSTLARRAYRRPVTQADLARLLTFYREGRKTGTFETGIQLALRRILASPTFVFRIEEEPPSPAPSASQAATVAPGTAYRVTDLELATRLSFFLWSSLPDDTLLDLAVKNQLRRPAVLEAQVVRMLRDPRAGAFVENFAGQWLHLRNLQTIAPNSDEFPDFDNDLRQGFRREAELFFESVLREDRSVLDLMTADYTFVNERLAKHYGLPNVYGSHFRRVTLQDEARRGLLGKGSVLMATSHADRTAPVLRGKWVLENILGTPPPAPPADVPPLEQKPGAAPKTLRERMEAHRASPACASCHRAMDPIGFAMENLDAIGGWRTRDAGASIDASGQLTDGTMVDGVVALRQALLRRPEIFVGTLTEKLMIYALGRGLQHYDMPVVRRVVNDAARENFRFTSLILGIVKSAPFQMRTKA